MFDLYFDIVNKCRCKLESKKRVKTLTPKPFALTLRSAVQLLSPLTMGRKLKDSTLLCDSEAAPESPQNMKNKKHSNKDDTTPKRKLQEIEPQKKKKKHKNKPPKEDQDQGKQELKPNDKVDDDETVGDGLVVVTGQNVKLEKYAPLKSFSQSGLPQEVLECCKNFQTPSSIQSRAWPFLLDGRDFIGIAATGSGTKLLALNCLIVLHCIYFVGFWFCV